MERLLFAPLIIEKIFCKFPPVTVEEVEEAFFQWDGFWVLDDREDHKSVPPTYWFISETCDGRLLKVVIKPVPNTDFAYLRTAYDADEEEEEILIYEKKSKHCRIE